MRIQVGDRLMETVRPHRVWVVTRITAPQHGRPHASLRQADDPGETRLLSCAVLEDDRRFKKVAEPPTRPDAPPPRRDAA